MAHNLRLFGLTHSQNRRANDGTEQNLADAETAIDKSNTHQ